MYREEEWDYFGGRDDYETKVLCRFGAVFHQRMELLEMELFPITRAIFCASHVGVRTTLSHARCLSHAQLSPLHRVDFTEVVY